MADLEQRRQQYWENQRQEASARDPNSLRAALALLSLLPMDDANKAAAAEWLTSHHKAGVVPENRPAIAEAATQAGLLASYAVPQVGIPLNMAYEADKLDQQRQAGAEGNAAPLALAMLPMGGTARAATKGGRIAKGLEGILAPVAVGGGSMLMSDMANAGEADQGAAEADPLRASLQGQLEQMQAELATATAAREAEAKTGRGPRYDKAAARVVDLENRLADMTKQMGALELDRREQAAGHSNRIGMGAAGLGGAALLSLVPTVLSRGHAASKVASFKGAADELARITPNTSEHVIGTKLGDDMTALVNEAYKDAGARMPFMRGRGGPVAMRPDAKRAGDEALFAHSGSAPGDMAFPLALTVEGIGGSAAGAGQLGDLSPEARRNWEDAGALGLGAALGYKGGRFAGKAGIAEPTATARAAVTSARSRLEREIQAAEPPSLWSQLTGGARASQLPAKSTKQLGAQAETQSVPPPLGPVPAPQGPQALPSSLPAPGGLIPGSLAPEVGAKKVKQPRPRKDAQGRLRDPMGQFTKPRAK